MCHPAPVLCNISHHWFIGKTFLAGIVIEECQSPGNRVIYAFLTHTYAANTSAVSIFHSLIFQLASKDDNIRAALCQSARETVKTNLNSAVSLLKSLLDCAGVTYLVVDGADEIDKTQRRLLLDELVKLSADCDTARVLICSRAEADIERLLGTSPSIRVDQGNIGSIQAFVNHQAKEWIANNDFLAHARGEIEALLAPVASKAKGMSFFHHSRQLRNGVSFLISGSNYLGRHVSIRQGHPQLS